MQERIDRHIQFYITSVKLRISTFRKISPTKQWCFYFEFYASHEFRNYGKNDWMYCNLVSNYSQPPCSLKTKKSLVPVLLYDVIWRTLFYLFTFCYLLIYSFSWNLKLYFVELFSVKLYFIYRVWVVFLFFLFFFKMEFT